jgi:hypothetical protein
MITGESSATPPSLHPSIRQINMTSVTQQDHREHHALFIPSWRSYLLDWTPNTLAARYCPAFTIKQHFSSALLYCIHNKNKHFNSPLLYCVHNKQHVSSSLLYCVHNKTTRQ